MSTETMKHRNKMETALSDGKSIKHIFNLLVDATAGEYENLDYIKNSIDGSKYKDWRKDNVPKRSRK